MTNLFDITQCSQTSQPCWMIVQWDLPLIQVKTKEAEKGESALHTILPSQMAPGEL